MTSPQNVDPDGPNPPQFDSLTKRTRIVTVQIGGNDIGFSCIARDCANATSNEGHAVPGPLRARWPRRDLGADPGHGAEGGRR